MMLIWLGRNSFINYMLNRAFYREPRNPQKQFDAHDPKSRFSKRETARTLIG
jgi:hypothetical protein